MSSSAQACGKGTDTESHAGSRKLCLHLLYFPSSPLNVFPEEERDCVCARAAANGMWFTNGFH